MAKHIGLSTGTFLPTMTIQNEKACRDRTEVCSSYTTYFYDFRYRKEGPETITKWLRKNFGERGHGYDFILNFKSGTVQIKVWDSRLKFMYEMWKT